MQVTALRAKLRRLGVPEDAYSLGDGLKNEAYVLERSGSAWVLFYSERGMRTGEQSFASEDAACAELLRQLRPGPTVWPLWGRLLFWLIFVAVLVVAGVGALHAEADPVALRVVASAVIIPSLAAGLIGAVRAAVLRRRSGASRARSDPAIAGKRVSAPGANPKGAQPEPGGALRQETLEELMEALRQEQMEPPWRRSTQASDESLAAGLELLTSAHYFLGRGSRDLAMGKLAELSRLVGETWAYRSPLAVDILSISPVTW